jgi:hypothetical protein
MERGTGLGLSGIAAGRRAGGPVAQIRSALRRVRADIGARWDLIILGQCNPRACLRSLEADIPINRELLHSFQVARWPANQLRVVRNLREDIFLLGDRIVGRRPYTPPSSPLPPARVIAPDVIGCQDSAEAPEGSSMTDVFILSGRWTDRATSQKSRRELEPTDWMIRQADRQVQRALASLLRGGTNSLTRGDRRKARAAGRSSS